MDDTNTFDSLAQGLDELGSGDGVGAGSPETLTLEEINTLLGKDFKDKTSALKAVKDTFSYVGKAGQVAKEAEKLKTQLAEKDSALGEISQIKEQLFYSENPQYKPFKDTIKAMGNNPADVVATDTFKNIFKDLSEFQGIKDKQSVLVSNPRIGQAKTKLDEARELEKVGQYSTSKATAVDAVLEAYELQ